MHRTMNANQKSLLGHIKNSTTFIRSLHRAHMDDLDEVSVDDLAAEKPRSARRQRNHRWREEDEQGLRDR
jgi:hypothetical protein